MRKQDTSDPGSLNAPTAPAHGLLEPTLVNRLRIAQQQRAEPMRVGARRPWVVAAALLLALLAGGGAWMLLRRPPLVQVAPAVVADRQDAVLQATGYVVAQRQATVSSQLTGTLTEVLVAEGQRVSAGQVIARLQDRTQRASLVAAQANVAAAESAVRLARAQLAQAEADERRLRELEAAGMIPRQAAEQARTQLATLAAQLEARSKEVEAARAQQEQARVLYELTFVRAPFSGVVTERAAQVGETVSPLSAGSGFTRTGIVTIVDPDSLQIEVDVNEAHLASVAPGSPAQAVLEAYPDWHIPTRVLGFAPMADRSKGTIKVRLDLPRGDRRLAPNLRARVTFLPASSAAPPPQARAVLIPEQAVTRRGDHRVVFVVANGVVQERRVVLGERQGGAMALVAVGLRPGEHVVIAPPVTLTDGAAVRTSAKSE